MSQVPGQEILDVADGMICDLSQHGAEIEFRIDAVELGRADERVESGGALTSRIGAGEEVILAVMAKIP